MTSRERVRKAVTYQEPDRVPAGFEAVDSVLDKLMRHYGFTDYGQLVEKYQVDIVPAAPQYMGPPLREYKDEKGRLVKQSYWGFEETFHKTDTDIYGITTYYPLNEIETAEDVDQCTFPDADCFDYSTVTETCEKYQDKAIIVGHEGPFQIVTYLIEMERFFVMMLEEPEIAERILERMLEFELEYYRRIFEAGKGKVDILRPHDDYGTQISLLFGVDMWREFFAENTKKLVNLAHEYGAFYQQHSCGAVAPLIPEFINCGVDILEPIQKVQGLEPENLQKSFGGKIAFHGGIDTQNLLPYGSPGEIEKEVRYFIDVLGKKGGYILMGSQAFEGDVPIENIEALYNADRR